MKSFSCLLILFGFVNGNEWFDEFHSLSEIGEWFRTLAGQNSNRMKIVEGGSDMFAVEIGTTFNEDRPAIVIDCGKYGSDKGSKSLLRIV